MKKGRVGALPPRRSGCPPSATLLTFPWDMRYRAGVRSRLIALRFTLRAAFGSLSHCVRLSRPTGCLRQATQPAPAGMCSLPVDFATLHPSGCPRQSFSLRSIMSPYGLPSAGSVGSHPPRDVSPFGLLMQPTSQPPGMCSGLRFQVSGFRFQVSGFRFQVSAFSSHP